jgi:L-iditol 2-dehydrogenase
MKSEAIFFVKPLQAEIRDIEVPDPGHEEVQVECLANGICLAEVSVYTGIEERILPRIPGHEGIGRVTKVGSKVQGFAEGDTVTCWEWAKVANYTPARLARYSRRPADVGVWLAEPVECIVKGIESYAIVPGDRALVIGAGYMGLLNIQGLAHCPLAELVVVDLKAANLKLASSFGATRVIQAGTKAGDAELEELKKTRPFDLVVETAGSQATIGDADRYARRGGRLSIFAWHHGARTVDMGRWHLSGLRVLNSAPQISADSSLNYLDRAVRLMERGFFDESRLITHRHSFRAVTEAMEVARQRPPEYIKGVLMFS